MWTIVEANLAYGGVAPKTVMALKTSAALEGKPLTHDTLQTALKAVAEDIYITPDAPGIRTSALRAIPSLLCFDARHRLAPKNRHSPSEKSNRLHCSWLQLFCKFQCRVL